MHIDTTTIKTISDLQAIYDGGIIANDRGNGSGGPQYITKSEARGDESDEGITPITVVSESDDQDAWDLAVYAAKMLGLPTPTIVAVGMRQSGDNSHQMIYAV